MYTKTLIARYALYVFIALEVLLLPKLIPAETYTSYEYIKSIVFMFPVVLLGSYSGFIYSKYATGSNEYPTLLTFGLISSLLGGLLISAYYNNLWYVFPFIIINVFTIIEQRLKVDKKFILAFSFKPLLSIVILLIGVVIYSTSISISFDKLLFSGFTLAIIIWLVLASKSGQVFEFIPINKLNLSSYKGLIMKGFPIAFGSIVLAMIFFSDRHIVANYYNDYLLTYSFGFNLSQVLVMALSTLAYVSAIDMGENKNNLTKDGLAKIFKKSLIAYVGLLILLVPGVMVLNIFYEYQELVLITFIISYSKGFYFLLTIISSVVLYFDFQWHSLIAIIFIGVVNYGLLLLSVHLGYSVFFTLVISSISLFIYSLYILNIIFNKINYDTVPQGNN